MSLIATPSITLTQDPHGRELRSTCDTLLAPITKRIGAWAARARQRRALADLDDWMLADVGITRAAAKAEASKPFWQ
jgi:uncharacterized protein YjiS (DUF1127 family)